jgi:uncharacterized membrane protein YgdD (TMEM256/DUF423 family)
VRSLLVRLFSVVPYNEIALILERIKMDRLFFAIGSISALIGVAAGAFGAHGLKSRLSAEMLVIFETGVRYQMYHALATLAAAWAVSRWPGSTAAVAGWCFLIGTLVFSGSLYLLSLTGARWLGAITPLGGVAFLLGWLFLAYASWKS